METVLKSQKIYTYFKHREKGKEKNHLTIRNFDKNKKFRTIWNTFSD